MMLGGWKGLKKNTSFHNVRVDSGSYLDMDSTTGSVNALNGNIIMLNDNNHNRIQKFKNLSSSSFTFSSPFLETTWTSLNITLFIIYMLFQTFMPVYWSISKQIYNYPLTSICIQLFISIIILLIYATFSFHCCFKHHPLSLTIPKQNPNSSSNNLTNINNNQANTISYVNNDFSSYFKFMSSKKNSSGQQSDCNISPIDSLNTHFFKHFFSKFMLKWRLIILPSAFLALNIVVANVAITKGSMDIHILLRATEIIWFVVLSPFLLTDYPSKSSVIATIIITFGAICFSWTDISHTDSTFTIITCNLLSAIFQPFQILFLRRSVRILTMEESETRTMDGINVMTRVEMTLFYLICALFVLLPFQLIFEGSKSWHDLGYGYGANCNWILIIIGSILLLLYELNIVLLTANVEPILICIGQQSEELWRFIISMFLGGITLKICNCFIDKNNDGEQCNIDINNRYPICPCFDEPDDIFSGTGVILHWFGLLFIILGLIFYTYLKAKNTHVTNVNIFKFNR
eukprot:546221_1